MATHDYVLANAAGAAFRSDLNNALAAIVSQNSSATEPTTTYAYMPWFDTTNGILKFRNASNTGWVIDDLNSARGSVTMHATTMDIWAEPKIVDGTGSAVTITDIADAPQAGAVRILYPVAGTTITDGATFDVDGGANYTTAAGDALIFEAVTTSTFKVHIVKADGTPVAGGASSVTAIPEVPQTVLSGPIDSSGYAAFGGTTGTATLTASGTIVATCGAGGNSHRTGSITNPAWTSPAGSGTGYLMLAIAADGTVTTSVRTLQPSYQWGGTYSTTNGQFTYNIQENTGKAGNGSVAAQVYEVCIGECPYTSGVWSGSPTWYALKGRYDSGRFSITPSTGYNRSHNLGCEPTDVQYFLATSGGALTPGLFFYTSSYQGVALYGITRTAIQIRAQGNLPAPGSTDGLSGSAPNEMKVVLRRGW